MNRKGFFLPTAALLGFVFLYAPIMSLIIFSFNENKLVTVWSRFSTKWYGELFNDDQIMGAAWISLQIAFTSAIAAYGAFFIPKLYGTSISMTGAPNGALWGFLWFYVVCAIITWIFYSRKGAPVPC